MLNLGSGPSWLGWLAPLAFGLAVVLAGCGNEVDGTRSRLLTAILDAEDARGGGPTGLSPLLEGLGATDPLVQRIAVRALGRFESPEHLGPISGLWPPPPPKSGPRLSTPWANRCFLPPGTPWPPCFINTWRQRTITGVRGVMGRTLGRLRYDDPNLIQEAEGALLALTLDGGADAPIPSLTGAVMGLEWLVRRNRGLALSEPSIDRLQALTSYGLPSTRLEPEEAARVRRVALMTLTAAGGAREEVISMGLSRIRTRTCAVFGLAAVGRSPEFPGLLEAIGRALSDSIPRVRAQAVAAFNAKAPEDQSVCWLDRGNLRPSSPGGHRRPGSPQKALPGPRSAVSGAHGVRGGARCGQLFPMAPGSPCSSVPGPGLSGDGRATSERHRQPCEPLRPGLCGSGGVHGRRRERSGSPVSG